MRKLLFITILLSSVSIMFAGGLLTNTNQSVHFLRNPALDASTQIDAVYTNPAGLIFLSDGYHLSFSNQSVYQTRTITSTFAPFATSNGGDPTIMFEGTASAPIVPSFQFAYKKDKYAISAAFAVTGGGGKAIFNEGLPSFEAPISMLPLSLTSAGVSTTNYSVDSYMEGRQYIFGLQLNGSYKINDQLSAALGMRLNIVNNKYVGHLKNIMINPIHPSLNPGGTNMAATDFFTNAASASQAAFNSLAPIVDGGYGSATMASLVAANVITTAQLAQLSAGLGADVSAMQASQVQTAYGAATAAYTVNAAATADKELDCTQSGWGVTPILSLNYHLDRLNLAVKYEFKSTLNVENKTEVDDTGLYADGVNTPHDIPALFTAGAEYGITDNWNVSVGYHHFFDSDAKMANDKQQYIDGGVNEFLAGTEYELNKFIVLSTGIQFTKSGVTDAYQNDLSYSLDSYSVGFGGAFNISPKLRMNLAYFVTNYDKWTKNSENYNGTGFKGTDVYGRTNKVVGIGVEYKF